jgi:hypothetical protein
MKLNAAQYADDGPAERDYVFTHASLPGVEFPITLVFPGLLEEGDVQEAKAVYRAEYLKEAGGKRGKFMVASGDERELNTWACDDISQVFALQGKDPKKRYQWQELGDIATTRKLKPLWDQASSTCIQLLNGTLLPNSPGAAAPSSNGSASEAGSSTAEEKTGATSVSSASMPASASWLKEPAATSPPS